MKIRMLVVLAWAGLVATGCGKPVGDMSRTPDQWKAEFAPQMEALIPQFRQCYIESKAKWASAGNMGKGSVTSQMKPKAREAVTVSIYLNGGWSSDPKIDFASSHTVKLPPGEETQDGNTTECVRAVVRKNLKKPAKTDTSDGDGTWVVVFTNDAAK